MIARFDQKSNPSNEINLGMVLAVKVIMVLLYQTRRRKSEQNNHAIK